MSKSKCHSARTEVRYDPLHGTTLFCVYCGNPCEVKSEAVPAPGRPLERVTYNASKDEVIFPPAPDRLLSDEEILLERCADCPAEDLGDSYSAADKFCKDCRESMTWAKTKQDAKTASLKDEEILDLRDEAKEREGFIKTLIDKMAGKDAEIAELKKQVETRNRLIECQVKTHQAKLEKVLQEIAKCSVKDSEWLLIPPDEFYKLKSKYLQVK